MQPDLAHTRIDGDSGPQAVAAPIHDGHVAVALTSKHTPPRPSQSRPGNRPLPGFDVGDLAQVADIDHRDGAVLQIRYEGNAAVIAEGYLVLPRPVAIRPSGVRASASKTATRRLRRASPDRSPTRTSHRVAGRPGEEAIQHQGWPRPSRLRCRPRQPAPLSAPRRTAACGPRSAPSLAGAL